MSRELTTTLATETAKTVTAPGYLVAVELESQTLRMSSRGDTTWRGDVYIARGLQVQIERNVLTGAQDGRIGIDDADKAYTAILLTEGIADRRVRVWKFYGDADPLGWHDAVPVLSGVGDELVGDVDAARIGFTVTDQGGRAQFSPRRYITRQEGFSIVPPRGTVIRWGGQAFKLDRED